MKRTVLIGFLALVLSAGYVQAQMGSGMMGQEHHEEYSEEMGSGMMGRGMMGRGMMGGMMGRGMGYGMMGGYGMGCGMMGGHGMGRGMGPAMMAGIDDPEKQMKFLDETVELRKKIHDKMFEYHEASRNPKSTVGSLNDMEKEIYDLRKELFDKAKKYQESE